MLKQLPILVIIVIYIGIKIPISKKGTGIVPTANPKAEIVFIISFDSFFAFSIILF